VGSVWVRAQGDVLVRADAIVVLALGPEGLRAECGTGAAVRLAGTPCSTALMLGLAEAIDRAGRGDSRAVIVTPPAEPGSAAWRWEWADNLLEDC
jgi:hypothetical protein